MSTKAIRHVLDELWPNHRVTEDDLNAARAEVDAIERHAKLLVDPHDWIKAEEFFAALGTETPAPVKTP